MKAHAFESPIPVFAALAGLGLGTFVAPFAADVAGGGDLPYLVGPVAGGVAGSVGAGAGAAWAVRRGALARIVAAGIVGLVMAGGVGTWAATEIWQETHQVRTVMSYPPVCIERVGKRGQRCRWAPNPRPPVVLVGDAEEVGPGVAAAGGIPAGIAGASLAAFLEATALRRRSRR